MHLQLLSCLALVIIGFGYSAADPFYPHVIHAQIRAYQRQRALSMPMARGGASVAVCYDKYLPLIHDAAEQGKNDTQLCINQADEQRDAEIAKAEARRQDLDAKVAEIEASLNECLSKPDIQEYLKCLVDTTESNKEALDAISQEASQLANALSAELENIKSVETVCINAAIEKAKNESDRLFDALGSCLINGGEEPEPSTTEPAPAETTSSPSEAPETTPAEPSSPSEAPETSPSQPSSSSEAPETTPAEPSSSSEAPETSPQPEPEPSEQPPEELPEVPEPEVPEVPVPEVPVPEVPVPEVPVPEVPVPEVPVPEVPVPEVPVPEVPVPEVPVPEVPVPEVPVPEVPVPEVPVPEVPVPEVPEPEAPKVPEVPVPEVPVPEVPVPEVPVPDVAVPEVPVPEVPVPEPEVPKVPQPAEPEPEENFADSPDSSPNGRDASKGQSPKDDDTLQDINQLPEADI